MAQIESWFEQDLKKPVPVRKLERVFNEDSQANVIGVQLYDDGVALTSISGSVTGYFLLADGTTTSISGTKSGGKASVVIPPAAYKVTGPITITIRITDGSDITTVCACVGLVMLTKTPVVTPAGSTVADWSAQISAQLAACQAAADAVGATVAVPFNESVANDAGTYVTSSGHMYYLPNGHTADTSLANTTKIETNCGTELTNLKSAIQNIDGIGIVSFVKNHYIPTSGSVGDHVDLTDIRTSTNGYMYAIVSCCEGDVFTIKGSGASTARLWCFLDSSDNICDISSSNKTLNLKIITAPLNATKLVINSNLPNTFAVKEKNAFLSDNPYIYNGFYTIEKTDLESGSWQNGSKITSNARGRIKELPFVKKGTVVVYHNSTFDTFFSVVDSDGNALQTVGWTFNTNGTIIINADGYLTFIIRSHSDPTEAIDVNDYNSIVTVYSNMGDIAEKTNEFVPVTFTYGYIVTNTAVINPNIILPSSEYFQCAIIDCDENASFLVSGKGGSNARLWCFVDKDYNQLMISGVNATGNLLHLTAPKSATKLIVNDSSGNGKVYPISDNIKFIINEISNIPNDTYNGIVKYQWMEGAYINADGEEIASVISHHTDFIKINNLFPQYILYAGYIGIGSSTRIRVHAYDKDGNWIRQVTTVTLTETDYKIPVVARFADGEEYFIVSCSNVNIQLFTIENMYVRNNLTNLIENAYIRNMKGSFVCPTISTVCDLQDDGALTAKASIFKNNDYYCAIFQQNIDGTADDVPRTSGSGVIALKYKKFRIVNGEETDVEYGMIAQKGDTYTDYQGNTATFEGGVGKPSGNNGMQFCTAAATGNHRYNGIDNYGMTPCAFTVSVTENGVNFGTITELKLDINGTVGKFDVLRLSENNQNYYVYYTLTVPSYDGSKWHWLIPVFNGIAYFTSDNGFDWTYMNQVMTPFCPYADVSCENMNSSRLMFAARINGERPVNPSIGDCTVVGIYNKDGYIESMYKMSGENARTFIAKLSDYKYLLFTNLTNVKNASCLYVEYDGEDLFFYEWFNIYQRGTWYSSCYKDNLSPSFNQLIVVGTDGQPAIGRKSTFMILDFPTGPRSINDISFGVS